METQEQQEQQEQQEEQQLAGRPQSVYRRGASDGTRLGLWIVATFFAGAYSVTYPILGTLSLLMALAVPIIVYRRMASDWRQVPSMRFFSAIWMHGIAMFFFASLLLAVAVYVFLRWMEPAYLVNNVTAAIKIYAQLGQDNMPQAAQMAQMLQQMLDHNMLPSPASLAFTTIWTVTFTGSMLSIVLAWMVRIVNRNKQQ